MAVAVVGAFFAGISAGLTLGGATIVGAGGAFSAGLVVGQWVAANAIPILLGVSSLALQVLQNSRPMASAQLNIRVEKGPRWHHIGRNKIGGQVIFGKFAPDGSFWYVIYHSDSELVGTPSYMLDDIPVTLDGDRKVNEEEFQSETEGALFGLLPGEKKKFFTIWTVTHTPADRVPPRVAQFDAAFPEWSANHKMVGTTCSFVKIDAVDKKAKPNIYKWQQGALRMGEPGLSIIGDWGRVYDPRTDNINDQMTWGPTGNPALIAAWNRYDPFHFNRPLDEINWTHIAAEADHCDITWINKYGQTLPTYSCAVAFDEEKPNAACEVDILLGCDGSVFFDDDGKWYIEVGKYETPDVTFTADRDIYAMESRDVEDGEAEMDGVEVEYIDESRGFITVVSAPWVNPNFFVPGSTPRFLRVSIPSIRHHSLAVKAAKIIGSRAQATRKVGPTVGPRALLATQRRLVALDYPGLSGAYQIPAPVEMAPDFMTGTMGLVPASADMWVLDNEEEGDVPRDDASDDAPLIPLPTGVDVEAVFVPGTGSASFQLLATFDPPTSPIYSFEFSYSLDGGATWSTMTTNMSALSAESRVLDASFPALVRYRTVTSGGNASGWSGAVVINGEVTFDNSFVTFDVAAITWDGV